MIVAEDLTEDSRAAEPFLEAWGGAAKFCGGGSSTGRS